MFPIFFLKILGENVYAYLTVLVLRIKCPQTKVFKCRPKVEGIYLVKQFLEEIFLNYLAFVV